MAVSVSATTRTNGCTAISSCTIPQTPFFQNLSFPLNFRPIPTNSFHLPRLKRMLAISNSRGTESNVLNEKNVNVLDNVKVYDLSGKGVPISDLWKDRRAVVAFARHFGCVLCRKRADDLAAVKDKMDAAGVALVLIGPGNVDQAKTFRAQTEFRGEIYADPSHASYTALRFVSGVSTTFTPGDWGLSSEKDTRERGGWQQGGTIVAGPGKTNLLYIHKDKEAGDDPPITDILRACCMQG